MRGQSKEWTIRSHPIFVGMSRAPGFDKSRGNIVSNWGWFEHVWSLDAAGARTSAGTITYLFYGENLLDQLRILLTKIPHNGPRQRVQVPFSVGSLRRCCACFSLGWSMHMFWTILQAYVVRISREVICTPFGGIPIHLASDNQTWRAGKSTIKISDVPSYKPPFSAGIFQPAMFETRWYLYDISIIIYNYIEFSHWKWWFSHPSSSDFLGKPGYLHLDPSLTGRSNGSWTRRRTSCGRVVFDVWILGVCICLWFHRRSPLVVINIANWKMTIDIVDIPIQHGDFP